MLADTSVFEQAAFPSNRERSGTQKRKEKGTSSTRTDLLTQLAWLAGRQAGKQAGGFDRAYTSFRLTVNRSGRHDEPSQTIPRWERSHVTRRPRARRGGLLGGHVRLTRVRIGWDGP